MRKLFSLYCIALYVILCGIIYQANTVQANTLPQYIQFSTKTYFFWEGNYRPAIVLWLTPEKDFYLYANQETTAGKPTVVTAMLKDTPIENVDVLYPIGKPVRDLQDPTKTVFVYDTPTPVVILLPRTVISKEINIRTEGLLCSSTKCIPVRAIANMPVGDPEFLTDIRKEPWFSLLAPALRALMDSTPERVPAMLSLPIAKPTPSVKPIENKPIPKPAKQPEPITPAVPVKKVTKPAKTTTITTKTTKTITAKKKPLPQETKVIWYEPTRAPVPTGEFTYRTPEKPQQWQTTTTTTKVLKEPSVQSIPKPNVVWYRGEGQVPPPKHTTITTTPQKPSTVYTETGLRPEIIKNYIPPSVEIRHPNDETIEYAYYGGKYSEKTIYKKQPQKTPSVEPIIQPKPVAPVVKPVPVQRLWDFTPRVVQNYFEVTTLTKALIFAFLAGLILNFMPCVFPILSLKFSSFLVFARKREYEEDEEEDALQELEMFSDSTDIDVDEYSEYDDLFSNTIPVNMPNAPSEDRTLQMFRNYNIFFSLGVLVFFGILGVFLHMTGGIWGKLFQMPSVMLITACIVFALALSIFNVFYIPIITIKDGEHSSSAFQAFSTGMLTTLLATPCSAPLLGGVLSWLMLQPMNQYIIVMVTMSLGMILPYVLFILFPSIIYLLPKPGRWNSILEHIVGFFLIGTTLYLLSLLPVAWLVPALIILFIISVSLWIWGTFTGYAYSTARTVTVRILITAIAGALIYWVLLPAPASRWKPFTPQYFAQNFGKEVMVINFTADWCPNCKVLEKTVLTPSNIAKWQKEYNVTFLTGDITQDNPALQKLMQLLKTNSIPLLAVFPKGSMAKSPFILRDVYTVRQVEKALKDATR